MWNDMPGVQPPRNGRNRVYKIAECCNNAIYNLKSLTLGTGTCHKFDSIMHNLVYTNEVPTLVILKKQK